MKRFGLKSTYVILTYFHILKIMHYDTVGGNRCSTTNSLTLMHLFNTMKYFVLQNLNANFFEIQK